MTVRIWAVAALAACLSGCDYTVQLAKTPELPIDQALVGSWLRTDDPAHDQRLLVLPQCPNEYIVAYPANDRDAMFARACLCKADDLTLVQLTWFGTARGVTPDDARVYQYVVYSLKGDTLSVGLLNADLVKRDAATAQDLLKSLAESRQNPGLFREAMTFKKEPPPANPNAKPKRPPVPASWQ
jgi:hypothetical protein